MGPGRGAPRSGGAPRASTALGVSIGHLYIPPVHGSQSKNAEKNVFGGVFWPKVVLGPILALLGSLGGLIGALRVAEVLLGPSLDVGCTFGTPGSR